MWCGTSIFLFSFSSQSDLHAARQSKKSGNVQDKASVFLRRRRLVDALRRLICGLHAVASLMPPDHLVLVKDLGYATCSSFFASLSLRSRTLKHAEFDKGAPTINVKHCLAPDERSSPARLRAQSNKNLATRESQCHAAIYDAANALAIVSPTWRRRLGV